jgi:hypothetical protein
MHFCLIKAASTLTSILIQAALMCNSHHILTTATLQKLWVILLHMSSAIILAIERGFAELAAKLLVTMNGAHMTAKVCLPVRFVTGKGWAIFSTLTTGGVVRVADGWNGRKLVGVNSLGGTTAGRATTLKFALWRLNWAFDC